MGGLGLMHIGDYVRFGEPGGSVGIIESFTNYGNVYVRWFYGRDKHNEAVTALDSVHPDRLMLISRDEWLVARDRRFDASNSPKQFLTFDEFQWTNVRRCEEVFHKLHSWSA